MGNTVDFLWACKELYQKQIHPFDFSKSQSEEYQRLISHGKNIIAEHGIQDFLGLLMEGQYGVHVWAAFIALQYGNPGKDEILKISGKETIVNHCIALIQDISGRYPEGPEKTNQQKWIADMKVKYSVE